MEDDLKNNENGRQPNFFRKSKTTLIFDTGRRPQFSEDGRRPRFYLNGRQPKNKCNLNQQHSPAQRSTGNLTNTTIKNILAQLKKSTLIGCDIIVN
jgi:hypothetical protein